MKIVKITTVYPIYLNKFYAKNPDLPGKAYREQKSALDYDGFGLADFWETALSELGYESSGFVANAEPMQNAWASENGLKYDDKNWLLQIIEAQVLKEKPDILFVADYVTFSRDWLHELKQKCPSIKLVLGWCGAPYPDAAVFKAYDITISCIPELVHGFRQMGHKSEHVNHAFDPRILQRIDLKATADIDFSFIGQIVRSNQFHLEREYILEKLVPRVDLKIFSPSAEINWADDIKAGVKSGLYYVINGMRAIGLSDNTIGSIPAIGKAVKWKTPPLHPVNPKLRQLMRPPVFGIEMFQTLHNSKTTFNSHIDISPRSASNLRLYEATGAGTCQVTDWKENIKDLFEPDQEVVTYKSPEECIEKVKWLIDHPAEREAIAKAGQARTLACHTYSHRAAKLDEIIRKWLLTKE